MLEVRCHEKHGPVWRKIRPMVRTIEHILETVDRLKKTVNFLPADNEYTVFIDERNLFFEVDNVGLVAVIPWSEAVLHCHITFWDKRLRGREELCRSLAEFVTYTTQKPLITGIPETSELILAFAHRAGFEESSRSNGVVILLFTNYRE